MLPNSRVMKRLRWARTVVSSAAGQPGDAGFNSAGEMVKSAMRALSEGR
ncbi:hypothetical protein KCP73_15865 [Salmonella enterica subsp. enterica]|nr:hypothetical protein KCP73_15865 [Salmonella enterica subsp. enterica]